MHQATKHINNLTQQNATHLCYHIGLLYVFLQHQQQVDEEAEDRPFHFGRYGDEGVGGGYCFLKFQSAAEATAALGMHNCIWPQYGCRLTVRPALRKLPQQPPRQLGHAGHVVSIFKVRTGL
jgi:hypothetical protein